MQLKSISARNYVTVSAADFTHSSVIEVGMSTSLNESTQFSSRMRWPLSLLRINLTLRGVFLLKTEAAVSLSSAGPVRLAFE